MGTPELVALVAEVDGFLYDWQNTGESSTAAARRLLALLLNRPRLQEARSEFFDRLAKGLDPFAVTD
jgi:hypothetical protein